MVKLIATNAGLRSQAVRVHGGVTVVKPGKSLPVEPSPDLDDEAVENFAAVGLTFDEIDDDDDAKPVRKSREKKPKAAEKD